jgi:XapX domain-containing protein
MDIALILKSLATGIFLGAVFTLFKLPPPVPTAFAGVIGIIGIFIGYVIVKDIFHI